MTGFASARSILPVTGPLDATVTVPGSKSITNRALVCAALAAGTSQLTGVLDAEDTQAMAGVLRALGATVDHDRAGETMIVEGLGGSIGPTDETLDVAQSGTTSRFASALLALGSGTYQVTADPQMQARPMGATFDALRSLGLTVEPGGAADRLPATITAGDQVAGLVAVPGDVSSQFLSGLLLMAPCLPGGLTVELTTDLVSEPYVDLTIAVMAEFGAQVDRPAPRRFVVAPTGYRSCRYAVEPDASAASYPLDAAAICGGRVEVRGLGRDSLQGDAAFADVLAAMGCTVTRTVASTAVDRGGDPLSGGRFDFAHISDTAQTLAVVAPFASEPVTITGIGFIRRKEIDRVAAVVAELRRVGVRVDVEDDGWTIHPGRPRAATVESYGDHRMAMSFALLGLVTEGIAIAEPECVGKTFPGYWQMLASLQPAGHGR